MPRGRGPRRTSPEGGLEPPRTVTELQEAVADGREDVEELERLAELTELEWIHALLMGRATKRRNEVNGYEKRLRKMMGVI